MNKSTFCWLIVITIYIDEKTRLRTAFDFFIIMYNGYIESLPF